LVKNRRGTATIHLDYIVEFTTDHMSCKIDTRKFSKSQNNRSSEISF
jgi:hypothetical protein